MAKKKEKNRSSTRELLDIHEAFSRHCGPLHWWPGDSPLEVIVGAILTQNTAWRNVRTAIQELKRRRLMSLAALRRVPLEDLAEAIRSSGYFNQKAKKLKAFVRFLDERHSGKLASLFALDAETMRGDLLTVNGVGPETADSIVLYAAEKPTFVVDAYTKRLFSRHGFLPEDAGYESVRAFFMNALAPDAPLYNEYHAQIVYIGHHYCLKNNPRCDECPLDSPFNAKR